MFLIKILNNLLVAEEGRGHDHCRGLMLAVAF